MNIRDVNGSTNRSDAAQRRSTQDAQQADGGRAGRSVGAQAPPDAAQQDRVEISDAARSAQAAQQEHRDLDVARSALREAPGLDASRLGELRQRVGEGHYLSPEATRQVAERLLDALS